MTIHKALHQEMTLTDYVSRRKGGRGLANIEDSKVTSIQQHEDYMQRLGGD